MNKKNALIFSILIVVGLIFAIIHPLLGIYIDSQSAGFQIALEAISVFIFGGIVAYVLESQNRKYEHSEQNKSSNLSRLRYLRGIRKEIETILKPFEIFIIISDKERADDMIDKGLEIPDISKSIRSIQDISRTTYWDALVPSGLLPSVVSPELLGKISDFYHLLRVTTKMIEDYKNELQQDDLSSASRGISASISRVVQSMYQTKFIKQKIFPIFTDLAILGNDVVKDLSEEIYDVEKILGINHAGAGKPFGSGIEVKNDCDIEFVNIILINVNEFLTEPIGDDNNQEDEKRFRFILRLSNTPPDDWGDKIEYGSKKIRRDIWSFNEETEYYETVKVKGKYLIFEGSKSDLINNLASLASSIRKKNEDYRMFIKNKQEQETKQILEDKVQKKAFKEMIADIDVAINNVNHHT